MSKEITRKCGDCTACCSLLSIDDPECGFHKEPVVDCEHLKDNKCSIYETRPKVCAGFYCMWAVDHVPGMFREEDRPDLSGIMIVMNNPDSRFSKFARQPSFTAYEVRPAAFNAYWGEKLLKRVSKRWLLILMPWLAREHKYTIQPGTTFRGPSKLIDAVRRFNEIEDNIYGKDS